MKNVLRITYYVFSTAFYNTSTNTKYTVRNSNLQFTKDRLLRSLLTALDI